MHAFVRRPAMPGLLAALAAVALTGAALAEPAPPYAALLAGAASTAPSLAEAQAGVAKAEGLARQARALPNPVLGLEVENFSGSGPYAGADAAETTASLAQTLELGGKRSARIAAGRAGLTAAEAEGAQARAEFAARLAVAYAEAEAGVARVIQAEGLLEAAAADARAARELVDAGREAELRALQARAELEGARATLEEARAERDAAFARLSAMAGSPTTYDAVGESLLQRKPSLAASGPADAPAVVAARARREAAAAQLRVERGRVAPDLTVSAGVRRLAGDDATALVAGVSVPLPLFDRGRGAADAARAELSGAEARLRQAEFDAVAELRVAQAQARGATARVQAASAAETAAAEAYRRARLGYEAGRLPQLELTSARRALAEAQGRTLDAQLAQVRAEADLARLTGRTPFGG